MAKIQKTVFISYRRTNIYMARAVFDNLTRHGYDVFFDYESIDSGDFSQIILQSIESRAHFIIILTPSALERCQDPNDWLRREIEHALKHKRNIIPLTFEGFDFKDMEKYLPDSLAEPLSKYNGLRVPADYFDAAMERLRTRFLNVAIETVLHPTSAKATTYEAAQKRKATAAPIVTENQLSAEEYFERGLKHQKAGNWEFAIEDYTQAIRLKPDYAFAYNNRGYTYKDQKQYEKAIHDYNEALRVKPDLAEAYNNRGNAYRNLGRYDEAIHDYTRSIEFGNPELHLPYNNRGNAYNNQGKYEEAIRDYNKVIRLKPDLAEAYNNRGSTYALQGKYKQAKEDYEQALRINPNYKLARKNLEIVKRELNE